MAVNVGDAITAAQYNGLQSRIEQVLGNGSGNFGYGQAVTSSQVANPSSPGAGDGDSVTAQQMIDLRTDMNKAWAHQTGQNIPVKNIAQGDVIGADQTGDDLIFATDGSYTFDNPDITGGFNDYLSKMDELELNRFDIDDGEDDISDIATSTRTSSWNGNINCTFTCTFTDADHRRHFFNSGGQIRISTTGSNGSGSKDSDWITMITNPGQIQFGYNYTTVSGSTSGVTLTSDGNYDLSGTGFTEIMVKEGQAAVYSENRYRVEVSQPDGANGARLRFRVQLEDNDTGDRPDPSPPSPFGPLEDEDVTADITVTIGTRRAFGSNVQVANPSIAVTDQL